MDELFVRDACWPAALGIARAILTQLNGRSQLRRKSNAFAARVRDANGAVVPPAILWLQSSHARAYT